MVSLTNGDGYNNSGGYSFDNDSDDNANDRTPLMSGNPDELNHRHIHIFTGYISVVELLALMAYMASLIGITQFYHLNNSTFFDQEKNHFSTNPNFEQITRNDKILAIFGMAHSLLWGFVAILDRVIQWRHQVIRRRGYLKFYRKMRNIRRVPFVVVSTGTAVLLVYMSLLLFFHSKKHSYPPVGPDIVPTYLMYFIVGVELVLSLPCLIFYIYQSAKFNFQQPSPDVIQDTSSVGNSPTATLTTVGFRDGEDLDELLERQADMIRYLQQHNASLGRRIMELQSARTME